jgi:aspartyl-tRNA(Asn)/glutamyl-tRNA(Gln) amidotransferase subunit B
VPAGLSETGLPLGLQLIGKAFDRSHSVARRPGGRNSGRFQAQPGQMVVRYERTCEKQALKGETGDWEIVIGMEVHAQVLSNAKLFSGASTAFGAEPNSQVSFIDAGFPGMLPVINEKCVEQAVRTGLGLKAKINLRSLFDRKNYFFPDLPQGYQISQYKDPIVGEGEVLIDLKDGETIRVGIERLHLDRMPAKSLA